MKLLVILLIVTSLQVLCPAHRMERSKKRLKAGWRTLKDKVFVKPVPDATIESSIESADDLQPTKGHRTFGSNFFAFRKLRLVPPFFPQRRCELTCNVTSDPTSITTSTATVTAYSTSFPETTVTVTNFTTSTATIAAPMTELLTRSIIETRASRTTLVSYLTSTEVVTQTMETTYSEVSTVSHRATRTVTGLPELRFGEIEDFKVPRTVIEATVKVTRTHFINLATLLPVQRNPTVAHHFRLGGGDYSYFTDYDHFTDDEDWLVDNDLFHPTDYDVQYFRFIQSSKPKSTPSHLAP